jgi:hypothetical protein
MKTATYRLRADARAASEGGSNSSASCSPRSNKCEDNATVQCGRHASTYGPRALVGSLEPAKARLCSCLSASMPLRKAATGRTGRRGFEGQLAASEQTAHFPQGLRTPQRINRFNQFESKRHRVAEVAYFRKMLASLVARSARSAVHHMAQRKAGVAVRSMAAVAPEVCTVANERMHRMRLSPPAPIQFCR